MVSNHHEAGSNRLVCAPDTREAVSNRLLFQVPEPLKGVWFYRAQKPAKIIDKGDAVEEMFLANSK